MVVELKVDGALREESGLVGPNLVEDKSGAILRDHTRDERAVGDIGEFWRPRVGVRRVHAAWSEEPGNYVRWARISKAGVERGSRTH